MSEADLAQIVIAWLETLGGDVYQEVEIPGGRADIVARMSAEIWIVETKTSMSLQLIEQCMYRRHSAHRVYLACPVSKARTGQHICTQLGLGLLDIRAKEVPPRIIELAPSHRWNTRPVALSQQLQVEHKTHARAGAATGGHWTAYRRTCEALAAQVAKWGDQGVELRHAVDSITHHYASTKGARSTLAKRIADGHVPGVMIKAGRLYPVLAQGVRT